MDFLSLPRELQYSVLSYVRLKEKLRLRKTNRQMIHGIGRVPLFQRLLDSVEIFEENFSQTQMLERTGIKWNERNFDNYLIAFLHVIINDRGQKTHIFYDQLVIDDRLQNASTLNVTLAFLRLFFKTMHTKRLVIGVDTFDGHCFDRHDFAVDPQKKDLLRYHLVQHLPSIPMPIVNGRNFRNPQIINNFPLLNEVPFELLNKDSISTRELEFHGFVESEIACKIGNRLGSLGRLRKLIFKPFDKEKFNSTEPFCTPSKREYSILRQADLVVFNEYRLLCNAFPNAPNLLLTPLNLIDSRYALTNLENLLIDESTDRVNTLSLQFHFLAEFSKAKRCLQSYKELFTRFGFREASLTERELFGRIELLTGNGVAMAKPKLYSMNGSFWALAYSTRAKLLGSREDQSEIYLSLSLVIRNHFMDNLA